MALLETVMKCLLCVCLIVLSSFAVASDKRKGCWKFASTYVVSAPLTIAQVERQEMEQNSAWRKVRPQIPNVPFGALNPEWRVLKAMARPGDRVVRYSTDRQSWQDRAGEAGVALVRSGCNIHSFVTMMS